MEPHTAAGATFTPVSLDEMEKFIKRGFHALDPEKKVVKGEIVFDLTIEPGIVIRVWTSIHQGSQTGASVGSDAIRVQFYNASKNHPMVPGKAPIVKRTQNWRDNLRERIEDVLEFFEEKADYWRGRV